MQPFTIHCTTCQRSLRVTNSDAIGQILACPKCGSMVMVEAPPNWTPGEAASVTPGTPMLLSASTFVPPKPQQNAPPPSTTPTSIAATVASVLQAPIKAPVWKDPPPSATPVGEVLPKGVGSRSRTPPTSLEKPSTISTPEPLESPVIAVATVLPPQAAVPTAEVAPQVKVPTDSWPRWFLPGVAATVALGVVIFILRLLLQSSEVEPENVAVTPPAQILPDATTPEPIEPTIESTPSANTNAAVTYSTPTNSATNDNALVTAKSPVEKPNAAEPQPQDLGTASQTTAPPEPPAPKSPPMTPPAAQDVPPEPMPPGASEIATTDPMLPTERPNEKAPVDEASVVPTMQRVPPRQVNLEERLADPIKAFDVRNMPLVQFVDLLSELTTIPISLDLDALEQFNRSPTTPVSVQVKDKTVAEVLESALKSVGLGYNLERATLVVGQPQEESLRQVSYSVDDLANNDAALGELATLMRQTIAPYSWQQNGGKASMAAGNGKIVVEQTPAIHYKLLVLCEKLRVARGLPTKSRHDPAKFLLTTRETQAQDLLKKPITANFGPSQPLAGVLDWLRRATKATILVNHAALADAETSIESHCSVVADHKPLATMLDELLRPMELTWRAIDANTLEITTLQAATESAEIEFYPARDLAADAAAGKALVEQIKTQLGSEATSQELGVIAHFDVPSRTFIVRAPQRMQARVESFLTDLRNKK